LAPPHLIAIVNVCRKLFVPKTVSLRTSFGAERVAGPNPATATLPVQLERPKADDIRAFVTAFASSSSSSAAEINFEGREAAPALWRTELDAHTRLLENVKQRKQLARVSG
jgi:hypothetical protein